MLSFVDKRLPAINTKETAKEFKNMNELDAYLKENPSIDVHQEFWFVITRWQTVFSCVMEAIYEG